MIMGRDDLSLWSPFVISWTSTSTEPISSRNFNDGNSLMDFIKRIFIWWHSHTFGNGWTMAKAKARKIGEDEQGNQYFEEGGKPSHPDGNGRRRRWVVYHGVAEGSRVPPQWHGWLHHIVEEPPTDIAQTPKKFEKPYLPNMTGTPLAYRPKGSLARATDDAKIDQTYEAWRPENA